MSSQVLLKYKSFLLSQKEEAKKEFLDLIKGLCGETVIKINEDIIDLSSDFIDDDFQFGYNVTYTFDPMDGDEGYALVVHGKWHIDLIDSSDFLKYLETSPEKHIIFKFFFRNKNGDRETNVVGKFAGPFIKRLCSLHKELKPIRMIDRGPDENGHSRPPYHLPSERFKEYLDACFGTDAVIVLKLNQSS